MNTSPSPGWPRTFSALLPGRTVAVWVCLLLLVGSLLGQHRLGLLPPSGLLFVALALPLGGLVVVALVENLWRVLRGPHRLASCGAVLLTGLPPGLLAGAGLYTQRQWQQRRVPTDLAAILSRLTGASLMCLELDLCYPRRLESERLVMHFRELTTPEEDLRVLDEHVGRMEKLLGRPVSRKIHWVRGRLLGQGNLSFYGLALGSEASPRGPGDPFARRLDRHELAHALLDQHRWADSDPPMVLHEGWAMSQSGATAAELADRALRMRQLGRPHRLRDLLGPDWYHQDSGSVYDVGGAVVDHLLQRYGAAAFVRLYVECRPGTIEADCRAILGKSVNELDAEFWQEAERLATAKAP